MTVSAKFVRPFGPYLDDELLESPTIVNRFKNHTLTLRSLRLQHHGEDIGLDSLDRRKPLKTGSVKFRGILAIKDIRWLSALGREWLEDDLRDRQAHVALDYAITTQEVKVCIQGHLLGLPAYLTNSDGLQITSLDRGEQVTRVYTVLTLDKDVYSNSRVFLSRHRALKTIVLLTEKEDKLPVNEQTSKHLRTPAWLVGRYIDYARAEARARNEDPLCTDRHVHRCEPYHLFGRHADWLRDAIKRRKLLNLMAWDKFCSEVKCRRREREAGNAWSDIEEIWGDGHDVHCKEEDFEINELPESDAEESDADEPEAGTDEEDEVVEVCIYPPEEEGLRAAIDESDSHPFDTSANSIVLREIPHHIARQPVLPEDFIWRCPIDGCSYIIDFHNLSHDNLIRVARKAKDYLQGVSWKVSDPEFMEQFYDIVEHHYFTHLRTSGIKMVGYGTGNCDVHGNQVLEERRIDGPRQLLKHDKARYDWIKPNQNRPVFLSLHPEPDVSMN